MTGREDYSAFPIPRPSPRKPLDGFTPTREAVGITGAALSAPFADIPLAAAPPDKGTNLRFPAAMIPDMKDTHAANDPIRDLFFQMRSLAAENPFARNNAEVFIKQARFMACFNDDYNGYTEFSSYYPCYQHMGYEQLRTYFTWRSRVRSGDIQPTSTSYVFLYVYELLSCIGVKNPSDGLEKLMTLMRAAGSFAPVLSAYLPQWLKDYHICYTLPHTFNAFIKTYGLEKYYPEVYLFGQIDEDCLWLWNGLSVYDVSKSTFIRDGYGEFLKQCFYEALKSLQAYCKKRGAELGDLFFYRIAKSTAWRPFDKALYYRDDTQLEGLSEFSGNMPVAKDNRQTADALLPYSDYREMIGYLIKKTEVCARDVEKYKYRITANHKPILRVLRAVRNLKLTRSEIDKTILKAVMDYKERITRTVVSVDLDNLHRIRSEAMDTRDKLLIDEDITAELSVTTASAQPSPPPISTSAVYEALPKDGWAELAALLSPTEHEALRLAILNNSAVKAYCDTKGIMPEVLTDNINIKASDCIGDNIAEWNGSLSLYDDYRDIVMKWVDV
ncbi:MAG: TerB N-terminal domain-containing protein [Clostridia bacterium]|nr:TerB N-terminal domain-containing protein [Clostridia bacterium]